MTDIAIQSDRTDVRGAADAPGAASASTVGDFVQLLKPRVMSLVVFTAFVGMYLAPGDLHPVLALIAILCISVGAGASGAINMWYDRDIDAVMPRTRNRPIPRGAVQPEDALVFGVLLSVASVTLMALSVNWVAAGLLAFTILFYVVVYTVWLKRRTPQNIVIGGAAGALPPVVGWAAVTGDVSLAGIGMFLIIFMWTPPHFWALALYRHGDYEAANVPMLPVVAGQRSTRRHILAYALLLAPLTLSPCADGTAGWLYGSIATAAGALFVLLSIRVWRLQEGEPGADRAARRLFSYSILYLAILFAALIVDRLLSLG